MTTDEMGVFGLTLHYSLVFAFVLSAGLLFFYFWSKGRLDFDEEPKLQMMKQDKEEKP